jgi:hypothetical protein
MFDVQIGHCVSPARIDGRQVLPGTRERFRGREAADAFAAAVRQELGDKAARVIPVPDVRRVHYENFAFRIRVELQPGIFDVPPSGVLPVRLLYPRTGQTLEVLALPPETAAAGPRLCVGGELAETIGLAGDPAEWFTVQIQKAV